MLRYIFISLFIGLSSVVHAQDAGTIDVWGQASIAAKPDMARINIGVSAAADGAQDALAQMSTDLEKVLISLRAGGVADVDIQTSGLRLSERYAEQENYNDPRIVIGFTASSDLSVVVRDFDRLGDILDLVVSEGANRINGLSFDVTNRVALSERAQELAIMDAMFKAERFAKAAGVTLGPIVSMADNSVPSDPYEGAVAGLAASRSVPVAGGSIAIFARVALVMEIVQ